MVKDILILSSAHTLVDLLFIILEAWKIVGEIIFPEVPWIMFVIFKSDHAKLVTRSLISSHKFKSNGGIQRLSVTF